MAQERKNTLTSLKLFIKRLHSHCRRLGETVVPDDVKEGHFAIVATDVGDRPTRFVVGLRVLEHPEFLRLLKMAEEEYGFQQSGALEVPCGADEVRRILQDKVRKSSGVRDLRLVC